MSDTYIPIKKLSDVHNNEFYPLTAAKGTITTEDINVRNILGGSFGNKIPASSNLYDILVQLFGAGFKIDNSSLTDSSEYVPSSHLIKTLFLLIFGDPDLKFRVCTYQQYQQWVQEGSIDSKTLYFTTGGTSQYWIITFNANGGTVSETTRSVPKGSSYGTLPTAVYSGHVFQGWYTSSVGGSIVNASDVPQSNTTLYAHWSGGGEEDVLCFEEDFSKLVITEDLIYNISLNESSEPVLVTEVDRDPVETEDHMYGISLKTATEPLLATEVVKDPVETEDHQNRISLKTATEPLLATEIVKDHVHTEDHQDRMSLRTVQASNNTVSSQAPVTMTSAAPVTTTKINATQVGSVVTKNKRGRKRKTK